MKQSGKGSIDVQAEGRTLLTVRTTAEFYIVVGEDIVAPNKSTDRYAQITLENGSIANLETKGNFTIVTKPLPETKEQHLGESLVENIPAGELSIYDRLRAEMLGVLSQYAEARGMDTIEDENDFDFDEDDEEGLINTPYEYAALREEYPIIEENEKMNKEIAQNPSEEKEIRESENLQDNSNT